MILNRRYANSRCTCHPAAHLRGNFLRAPACPLALPWLQTSPGVFGEFQQFPACAIQQLPLPAPQPPVHVGKRLHACHSKGCRAYFCAMNMQVTCPHIRHASYCRPGSIHACINPAPVYPISGCMHVCLHHSEDQCLVLVQMP